MKAEKNWKRLDNAAKIFPSSDSRTDTQVFRISCELTDFVDPDCLQTAVMDTLERFPLFKFVLKRGLFWYYLEESAIVPEVRMEYRPPCSSIYDRTRVGLLFEVTYFRTRINLEVYHALCDGTGALRFLTTLVSSYLSRKHGIPEPAAGFDASRVQMDDDSFRKYYKTPDDEKTGDHRPTSALPIKGARYSEDRLCAIIGEMSAEKLLAVAHSNDTTITAMLSACLIDAISGTVTLRAKRKRPILISVPVNLRRFFPSESVRNFFSVVTVGYHYGKQSGKFADIITVADKELRSKLTPECLAYNINNYTAAERNWFARIIPLFIKDISLRVVYDISMKKSTATLSNLGIITMPSEMSDYISSFSMLCGTNRIQVCVCSFRDALTVGFTSPFTSTDIQRRFFRRLVALGVDVVISSNQLEDDDEPPRQEQEDMLPPKSARPSKKGD